MRFIDTHCHLDAPEFDQDRDEVAIAARNAGVAAIVVPAVARNNFGAVINLAKTHEHCAYALGIHPLFVGGAQVEDLQWISAQIETSLASDQPLLAIGEIGLDFFIPGYDRARQEYFFNEQLKLAKKYHLPVILHVRRSVDDVLKHLRKMKIQQGIAHAYNGSHQQADMLIDLGFKLGFGGAMTYTRALKIRELAASLPLEAIVLETDAPDIPPEWLGRHGRNSPIQIIKIAQVLADLRGVELAQIAVVTTSNAQQILPAMQL